MTASTPAGGGAIAVPAARRPPPPQTVPPAGQHAARIASVTRIGAGGIQYLVKWRFRAEGRQWTIPQECDSSDLVDILVDLGFAGQEVDLATLAGARAMILVANRASRTSAFVKAVTPIAGS